MHVCPDVQAAEDVHLLGEEWERHPGLVGVMEEGGVREEDKDMCARNSCHNEGKQHARAFNESRKIAKKEQRNQP